MYFGLFPIYFFARIAKRMGGVVGSLSFDVQGRGGGGFAQFGPIRTDRKRLKGVQKLAIFHGCHKCMVPKGEENTWK